MSVLLTGTESAKGIIAVRALGIQGVRVTTSSYKNSTAANLSKYSNDSFTYSDPKIDEMSFVNSLIDFLKQNKHDVLIPLHSRETYVISKYKKILEEFVSVPVADYDQISIANDKSKVSSIAKRLGLEVPRTYPVSSISEIRDLDIVFPVVIKLLNKSGNTGLSYAHNINELISKYSETVENFDLDVDSYPIIQEYINGVGCGTSVLYNRGNLEAFISHRRIREYPPSGGPSTCRISIKNNLMEKYSKRIMDSLNWHGVAMVEYKLEKKTNKPYLIEINPRFWGSMYQSIVSGLNIPYMLYLIGKGIEYSSPKRLLIGNKTRFLPLDLLSLPKYLRMEKNKINILSSYLSSKNTSYDIESLEDFRPTFNYYLEIIRGK